MSVLSDKLTRNHKKPLNLSQPTEPFSLLSQISIDGFWMTGVTSFEVYNTIFIISQETIGLKIFTFPDPKKDGTSYEKVADVIEKDWEISDNTHTDL